jgi:hypothetical protein
MRRSCMVLCCSAQAARDAWLKLGAIRVRSTMESNYHETEQIRVRHNSDLDRAAGDGMCRKC